MELFIVLAVGFFLGYIHVIYHTLDNILHELRKHNKRHEKI